MIHISKKSISVIFPLFSIKVLSFSYGTFFAITLLLIFFHKICHGDLSETIRPISKIFFRNDWHISEVGTLLRFLENSLQVPFKSAFSDFLRPFLCTQVLNNYQRYLFENFRVNRGRLDLDLYYLTISLSCGSN